ncbi:MAG: ethylbenzene dehydrogenase-related protein [Magnetococcus sp. YQC-5]
MKGIIKIGYYATLGVGLVSSASLIAAEQPTAPTPHYAAQLAKPAPPPEGGMQAIRINGSTTAILDPMAKEWEQAKTIKVTMQPQTVTTPMHANPAIGELSVRAMHNGQWLGVLLEWKDTTKNDRLVVDQFGDQVAVELPVNYRADMQLNPMMGAPGERVNIIQWRAVFQADLERKRDINIRDIYPNASDDLYPDQVLKTQDIRSYLGAVGVDNPVAKHRDSPVLDQVAEGFGSLTTKLHQEADGRGVWNNGVWRVVITTPMSADGANAPRLIPGDSTIMAFAVWDGSTQEVGARKSWSDWVPLTLAK